jgi:predicted metal-dependent phosphoesterase TrpH
MIVDFHVHSDASDGTFSPSEIAYMSKSFDVVALTDHDNTDGQAEFLDAGAALCEDGRGNLQCITGVELSIEPGDGFDKFHLLALGIDVENPSLKQLLDKILKGRNGRNDAIVSNFRKLGMDMTLEGLAPYAHGEVLARPHFARWLIDNGYASSIAEAFEKYLLSDSPAETRCYAERWHPPREEVFATVHNAGGLAVMAHPKFWKNEWKKSGVDFAVAQRGLEELKEMGLDGVEAIYQANTLQENVEFTRISTKLGFLKTAGSDFHGKNKPTIELGMKVDENFISPFLEALNLV